MSMLQLAHPGFYFFLGGLSLVVMAGIAHGLRGRGDEGLPWSWLSLFGLSRGLHESVSILAPSLSDPLACQAFRPILMAVSLVALVEFGRRGFRREGRRTLRGWLYLPLLALAALGGASGGLSGLQSAGEYVFGLPGGVLAGLTLLRAPRGCGRWDRAGLVLAALSLMAYTPARALPAPAIGAILATAAMAGLWLYHRSLRSPAARPGLLRQSALPVLFALLAAIGGMGTRWLETCAQAESEQTVLAGVEAAADRAGEVAVAEIEPRPATGGGITLQHNPAGFSALVAVVLVTAFLMAVAAIAYRM